MKIAVISPFYKPSVGGMQQTLGLFAEYFADKGCEVRVYTSQRQRMDELPIVSFGRIKHFPFRSREEGVDVFRFPAGGFFDGLFGVAYAASFKLCRPLAPFFYNLYQWRALRRRRLTREVLAFKPDAILAGPCVDYLMRLCAGLAKKTGARLVVKSVLHLSDKKGTDQLEGVEFMRYADGVLANTEAEKQYLVSQGIDADKIHMPNVGIDLERWAAMDGKDADKEVVRRLEEGEYVLYLGRKQEKKGLEELVDAFRIIRRERPRTMLVLAGEETDYFRANIAPSLAGDSHIFCPGKIDEPTKHWLFSRARVFSMVSRVDSFGIVYCESWFSGRPVIGADNRQMRGVIRDGEDGFLVPARDPAALAEKLLLLLEDPALADRMGEAGRRRLMRDFGDRAVERKLFKLLQG